MIALTQRRDRLAESGIKMCSKDASAGEIVFECCVGVASGKPERIGDSGLGDAVPAEKVHVILLVLGDKTLTAGNHSDRTRTPLHIKRVIIFVVFVPHPQED